VIRSLLIANRGEIACRIVRTARRLGIRTVAVFSDADRQAMHVREADEAVHIGPSPARESYLVGEGIIAAAKETGAEAIHPGYGFLSENADFAEAVEAAGLVWVGPKADSIRAMGLKDAAKSLMIAAGVPVTPGYLGEDQAPERLQAEAEAIGFPVLIKAVAGGGGKGMRRVEAASAFQDMLASCKREAASSFGDDRVLIEKYVERPRHIEVQVFGDTHGNFVHLFERDCSLQRRHQKMIEEAPAPGMDEATRAAVCEAAVQAAKAVDYVGAGTVEFIADASEGLRADRIWFMEMNTRLQVEHPVTEEITGVDLVEWQLRVASGEALPKRQEELEIHGWALEARLYAESPASGFLPSTGRLTHFSLPQTSRRNPRRIDTGVQHGDEITPYYDPMIAKIIVHRNDRETAAQALADACADVRCWPVKTNARFLTMLARDSDFTSGNVDTGMIARKLDELVEDEVPSAQALESVARLVVHVGKGASVSDIVQVDIVDIPNDPWARQIGTRLNSPQAQPTVRLNDGKGEHSVVLDRPWVGPWVLPWAERVDEGWLVADGGATFVLTEARGEGQMASSDGDGAIISPMPGRIISLEVRQGDAVSKGQKLLTLEAMKMEHSLVAPFDGMVAEVAAEAGAQVSEGDLLVRVEKGEGE